MDFQLNLASETVAQALPKEPLVVAPTLSLRAVLEQMQARNRGSVLVCSADGVLQGIFTERDVVKLLAANVELDTPIEKVMVSGPETIQPGDTVGKAISTMAQRGFRRMPVVDETGRPIGVLGVSRVLEYIVDHFPKVVYTLPPKPHQSSQEREGA